jgi:hypothetical protein
MTLAQSLARAAGGPVILRNARVPDAVLDGVTGAADEDGCRQVDILIADGVVTLIGPHIEAAARDAHALTFHGWKSNRYQHRRVRHNPARRQSDARRPRLSSGDPVACTASTAERLPPRHRVREAAFIVVGGIPCLNPDRH